MNKVQPLANEEYSRPAQRAAHGNHALSADDVSDGQKTTKVIEPYSWAGLICVAKQDFE